MEKAKILEQLIKESGMSVRAFAEKCGLPESTVYTILKKGAGKANVNNVIAMCKALGITVEQLDEMSQGISPEEPTYEDLQYLIARNGKNLSTEEKMKLIKMLSEL
ncbi:transcriptional regulator with XRE-family HTH domain [Anaerotaenia torta]